MSHVFVSHSSDNRELAQELATFLEAKKVRVWIAPRDVRPGADYSEQLQLAIETCAAFVVLVTEMANKSPYVRAETEMAFSSHKPIFPVRVTDIKPAPGLAFFLKIRHWTDAFGPFKTDNLDRLVRELQALSPAAAEAAAPPASPGDVAAAAAVASAPPAPGQPAAQPMPAMAAPAPPTLPASAEEEERWRAAIGPNADHYLGRWRAMAAKSSKLSWNWPACLVNVFWFAWRKMWLPMAATIGVLLLIGLLGSGDPSGQVTLLLSIAVSFVTGTFGNYLYRQQTAKLVATTAGTDRAATLEALRRKGGTSVPALIVSLAVVALIALLAVLAALATLQPKADGTGGALTGDPLQDGLSGEVDLNEAAPDKPSMDEVQPGY